MSADETPPGPGFEVLLAGDDDVLWPGAEAERHSLVDLVNRVLDRGVVITGNVTISVAGVELVYLGLSAVLTSVSTARRRLDAGSGPGEPGEPGTER